MLTYARWTTYSNFKDGYANFQFLKSFEVQECIAQNIRNKDMSEIRLGHKPENDLTTRHQHVKVTHTPQSSYTHSHIKLHLPISADNLILFAPLPGPPFLILVPYYSQKVR